MFILLLSEKIAMFNGLFNGLQRYKVSAYSHTVINYWIVQPVSKV